METREMISFELGKEIVKYVFNLVTSVGQKKILRPHEESNLRPSDSALRCSISEPQRLYDERGLSRSSYGTHPACCSDQQCR